MSVYVSPDAKISNSKYEDDVKIYSHVELRSCDIGRGTTLGDQSILLDSRVESNVTIKRRNFIQNSSIGRFTYTGTNTQIRGSNVGRFCSISWNVSIGGKNHDYSRVTNSTLWAFRNMDGRKPDSFDYRDGQEDCTVGSDVWIATNAVILRGAKIGDGAVIGAGSVVTKDVEPYSIVVGVPAKKIRYRFEKDIIAAFIYLKWWDWPIEALREHEDLIFNTSVDEKVISKLFEVRKSIQ